MRKNIKIGKSRRQCGNKERYVSSGRCVFCKKRDNRSNWAAKAKKDDKDKEKFNRLNRQAQRRFQLSKYGLTEKEYESIFNRQGQACAICRCPPPPNRKLAVDHCHKTGEVRGLLCVNCNTGLGLLEDSKPIIKAAIAYLKGSREE